MTSTERINPGYVAAFHRYRASDIERTNRWIQRLKTEMSRDYFPAALDLGCGVGRFTVPLSKCAGHVVAVDRSSDMLSIARETVPANVDYKFVDIELVQVKPDHFSLVFLSMVLRLDSISSEVSGLWHSASAYQRIAWGMGREIDEIVAADASRAPRRITGDELIFGDIGGVSSTSLRRNARRHIDFLLALPVQRSPPPASSARTVQSMRRPRPARLRDGKRPG